jgi:hypothetical protein
MFALCEELGKRNCEHILGCFSSIETPWVSLPWLSHESHHESPLIGPDSPIGLPWLPHESKFIVLVLLECVHHTSSGHDTCKMLNSQTIRHYQSKIRFQFPHYNLLLEKVRANLYEKCTFPMVKPSSNIEKRFPMHAMCKHKSIYCLMRSHNHTLIRTSVSQTNPYVIVLQLTSSSKSCPTELPATFYGRFDMPSSAKILERISCPNLPITTLKYTEWSLPVVFPDSHMEEIDDKTQYSCLDPCIDVEAEGLNCASISCLFTQDTPLPQLDIYLGMDLFLFNCFRCFLKWTESFVSQWYLKHWRYPIWGSLFCLEQL